MQNSYMAHKLAHLALVSGTTETMAAFHADVFKGVCRTISQSLLVSKKQLIKKKIIYHLLFI